MKSYRFSVIVEKDEDGFFAFAPDLQGCYTQGDSYEEVIEDILANGESIDVSHSVSLTSLEVAE